MWYEKFSWYTSLVGYNMNVAKCITLQYTVTVYPPYDMPRNDFEAYTIETLLLSFYRILSNGLWWSLD